MWEAIPDVVAVMMGGRGANRCVQIKLFYKISINSCFLLFLNQIAFEGVKGVSGFVALDDIKYTPGVNCDDQLVDFKPGEKQHWFKQLV